MAVGITQRPRLAFQKVNKIYWEAGLFLRTPFTEGCDGVNYQTLPPGHSRAALLVPLRSVQFSQLSVLLVIKVHRPYLLYFIGYFLLLRSLYSKFSVCAKRQVRSVGVAVRSAQCGCGWASLLPPSSASRQQRSRSAAAPFWKCRLPSNMLFEAKHPLVLASVTTSRWYTKRMRLLPHLPLMLRSTVSLLAGSKELRISSSKMMDGPSPQTSVQRISGSHHLGPCINVWLASSSLPFARCKNKTKQTKPNSPR